MKYKGIEVKENFQVTYLVFVLDETMGGEPVALKVANKLNGKLKFLYRNKFFNTWISKIALKCLHANAFWLCMFVRYPNLNINLKNPCKSCTLQIMQNKCTRFYLKLEKMHDISEKYFKTIKWLHVDQRVHQSVDVNTFCFQTCQ